MAVFCSLSAVYGILGKEQGGRGRSLGFNGVRGHGYGLNECMNMEVFFSGAFSFLSYLSSPP